ncbi:MAG: ankyrin repeat domain-containing protein, partial [Vicinamibacterales bacterium]
MLGEEPSADHLALALGGAAKGGHVRLCRQLLARGADVNSVTGHDRSTPLMHALEGSSAPHSAATVVLLLDEGVDLGVRNRNGTLALHMAAWWGAS